MFRFNGNNRRRVAANDQAVTAFAMQTKYLIKADVKLISVGHTIQSSVDAASAYEGGLPDPMNRTRGACTSALLDLLYHAASSKHNAWTWHDLLVALREKLHAQGHEQIPQLTSSRPIDIQKTPVDLGNKSGARKRALLIGVNYVGQEGELKGCHNDVYSVQHYLVAVEGYRQRDITLLADDGKHVSPSRHEILRALQALVRDSQPGDAVYFHFCGHGGLLFPEANDFKAKYKGYDETIHPVDHAYAGQILDQSLYKSFISPMKAGVSVTCVIDCCHSGCVLELPYSFKPTLNGGIEMRENIDALANIAFLQVLMGTLLPTFGFADIVSRIEETTGNLVGNYQGIGLALEDQQGASGVDRLAGNASTDTSDIGRLADAEYQKKGDGTGVDCDCPGSGILSFLAALLGGGGDWGFDDVYEDI